MTTPSGPDAGPASALSLAGVLLRRRRTVLQVMAWITGLSVVAAFVFPSKYTATTIFVPEVSSGDLPAGLAGIAGDLGIGLSTDATTSPRFFADVLTSRELTERTLLTRFPAPDAAAPKDSVRLLDYLGVDGDNTLDSLQNGKKKFDKMVHTDVDAETSEITLSVATRDRALSAAIANRMVQYLDEFNTVTRQTKARDQRVFVEGRMHETADELRAAELALKNFYEANRTWQGSPLLTFQEGEIHRQVNLLQDVYVTLNQEYEKARIDEVNNTPNLTIIDAAVPVQERSSPKRGLVAFIAVVLSFCGGVAWSLAAEYLARLEAADPDEYQRLRALLPKIPKLRR